MSARDILETIEEPHLERYDDLLDLISQKTTHAVTYLELNNLGFTYPEIWAISNEFKSQNPNDELSAMNPKGGRGSLGIAIRDINCDFEESKNRIRYEALSYAFDCYNNYGGTLINCFYTENYELFFPNYSQNSYQNLRDQGDYVAILRTEIGLVEYVIPLIVTSQNSLDLVKDLLSEEGVFNGKCGLDNPNFNRDIQRIIDQITVINQFIFSQGIQLTYYTERIYHPETNKSRTHHFLLVDEILEMRDKKQEPTQPQLQVEM